MSDLLDKETKQFLLILLGLTIFLVFFYPRMSSGLLNLNFSDQVNVLTSNKKNTKDTVDNGTIPPLDKTKDYSATVSTAYGEFEIDLFERDAPKNNAHIVNKSTSYNQAPITVPEKNFLIRMDVIKEDNLKIEDEINADYLGLNKIKVGESTFLEKLYRDGDKSTDVFQKGNLSKYGDFTLKEFYEKVLGYNYNPELITSSAKKYMVYTATKGPKDNGLDLFILMSDNAPQIDGRYTPVGQIVRGFEVIDKINENPTSNLTINTLQINIR
jgi:cyclophilin family peptidyl-prolyl cis-trans isomerase